MHRPPCGKCGGNSVYIDNTYMNVFLSCRTCGWRLYGEAEITSFVNNYQEQFVDEEEERNKLLREQQEQQRIIEEEDRVRRERLLQQMKQRESNVETLRVRIPGHDFCVGDMDPALQVIWAQPANPTEIACAWPPCNSTARKNSKYCSRQCTVRVAHRRARLRKRKNKTHKQAS